MTNLSKYSLLFLISTFSLFAVGGCHEASPSDIGVEKVYVPVAPDYSDEQMWNIVLNDADGSGADVFYIPILPSDHS